MRMSSLLAAKVRPARFIKGLEQLAARSGLRKSHGGCCLLLGCALEAGLRTDAGQGCSVDAAVRMHRKVGLRGGGLVMIIPARSAVSDSSAPHEFACHQEAEICTSHGEGEGG